MIKDDYTYFEKLMNRAALLTYQQKGKDWDELIAAMFEELAKYNIEIISAAVGEHVKHEKFFPTLADIVNRINGNVDDIAVVAWSHVVKAIERYGYYSTVRFPHPAIHYAIDKMGGWMMLCETLNNENEPFRRKDFIQFFKIGYERAAWQASGDKCRVPAYLMGFHDANNQKNGYLTGFPKVKNAITGEIINEQLALGAEQQKQHDTHNLTSKLAKKMSA